MKALIRKIRQILRDRRTRKMFTRIVTSVAAVVVFFTTYLLVLPAITMEKQACCGIEAHQHDDNCYEDILICELAETEAHHHTDACYDIQTDLTCTIPEHQHSYEEGCYDEDGNLICQLSEHVHDESCYEEQRELVCGLEETEGHVHDASCYDRTLTCGKEAHVHGAGCYDVSGQAQTEQVSGVSSTAATAYSEEDTAEYIPHEEIDVEPSSINPEEDAPVLVPEEDLSSPSSEEASDQDQYIPELDPLYFPAVLNGNTDVYYYKAGEGEVIEDSTQLTEWKKVEDDTVLGENDLLRIWLSYTIPAGSLNETNTAARYRLPSNLHLTDEQMEEINKNVNGYAAQFVDYNTLEIIDSDSYQKYLGVEAVEGTRRPSDNIEKYLQKHDGEEYISATVRAEDVFDEEGLYGEKGARLGTDLVFTFTPYTVAKNQNEYDSDGQPTKAGEKVTGWLSLDFNMDQVDWDEVNTEQVDVEDASSSKQEDPEGEDFVDGNHNLEERDGSDEAVKADSEGTAPVTVVSIVEKTAEIIFAEKDTSQKIDQIVASIRMVTGAPSVSEGETGEETSVDESVTFPAATFDDSIMMTAGILSSDVSLDGSRQGIVIPAETKLIVHVEAEEGTFPEGTSMQLGVAENMDEVASAVEDAVGGQTMGFHAVDITFSNADGEIIEPLKPVKVNITSEAIRKAVENDSTAALVVHLESQTKEEGTAGRNQEVSEARTAEEDQAEEEARAEEGTKPTETDSAASQGESSDQALVEAVSVEAETVSSTDTPDDILDTLSFEADSFSVYAVVYTVDFHYEINGKTYEFSIPGGGFISLEHLVEVLGIVSADENGESSSNGGARQLVANIESVEFSAPELVWIGKLDSPATVGALKEANGLNVEYSADLTEERIAQIDAQEVGAGDWALISLQPFTSEETLTITMMNGDQFVIRVTDYQNVTNTSSFDGTSKFIIWITGRDGKSYALKTDGSTAEINTSQIDQLGSDYQWTISPDGDRYYIRPAADNTKYLVLDGYYTEGSRLVRNNGNGRIHLYPPYTRHKSQRNDTYSDNNSGWILEGWDWARLNFGYDSFRFESHNQWCSDNINISKQDEHSGMIALSPMNENGILPGNPASGNVTSTHYKNMTIDGHVVDNNDDANLDRSRLFIPVEYNDNGTATITLPSNDQLGNFSVSAADSATHSIVQDPDKYQLVLKGWINIATGEYYNVSDGPVTATVSRNNLNVFYADWWPADYSYTIPEEQRANTVDTSGFVTIKMWDYNELYNFHNSDVWKVDGDTQKYIPRDSLENEEWYIKGGPYFQFVDNTDAGNCWQYGTLGNTQDRGRYGNAWSNYSYDGILGILGDQGAVPSTGVLESLFPQEVTPGSGVNYVGQGNYLFQYDENTKTYFYDSAENAAVYNQSEQRFYVSNDDKHYFRGPDVGEWRYGQWVVTKRAPWETTGGFFPLNDYNKTLTFNNGTINNWLGISMDLDFWLPDTPGSSSNANLVTNTATGQKHPMRFEFNGDDDVWVLIDGKLALDIGGIHEAVGGYIDFTTGEIRNAKGNTYQLSDMGIGAGAHTLSFYYLEQGGNASNCKITFNIAPRWVEEPVQRGVASVTKTWSEDTPIEAKQAVTFSLQTEDGTEVEGTTVGYTDGTDADGVWSYVWTGLDPSEDYKVVEGTDPRFDKNYTRETTEIVDVWAVANYDREHAFGSTTIILGNGRRAADGGRLLEGSGNTVSADIDNDFVRSEVNDTAKWTVEGYSTDDQHFYLKNPAGRYLSIRNGSIALVNNQAEASWFYMSPSGDLNDAHSAYRLKVNGDGAIAVGSIVNSADETSTDSPDRIHIYTYHDFFARTTQYMYENTYRTKEVSVRKEWSDSPAVDHSSDTITIALYQVAIDSEDQIVAEVEYPLTSPNTDQITGDGTITISGLPAAGIYEGQFVTYEYHVTEKTGKEGYISSPEQDPEDPDSWMIRNIAPDDKDQTTSLDITKLWKDKDGGDAGLRHAGDVLTFKLIQKAVECEYVPVTLRWIDAGGALHEEETFYIQKGHDLSFTVSKPGTLLPHRVRVTTDRGNQDQAQWNTSSSGTHTFTIRTINDAITVSAALSFLNDEWGNQASWFLQSWGHSVQSSAYLQNTVEAVAEASKNNTVDSTQDHLYELTKDDIEDGPFTETASDWIASITDLPLYKKIGAGIYHTYYYTISEISVNGLQVHPTGTTTVGATDDFLVSIDQTNMTITNTEKEKTTASAVKAWANADGSATPPAGASVIFELYADGTTTGKTVTLNGKEDVAENPDDSQELITTAGNSADAHESPAWTAVWNNLPKYTYLEDGTTDHEITYTIKEVTGSVPEGYAADYGPDGESLPGTEAVNGGTITNRQLTTSLEILKVDADGMTKPLEEALFEMRRINPDNLHYLDDVTLLPETGREDHKTGTDGKAVFSGLTSGYYEVKEAGPPDGYILTGDGILYIKVEAGAASLVEQGPGGIWIPNPGNDQLVFTPAADTDPASLTIGNETGAALPSSGGPGTRIFMILGGVLILAASALGFRRMTRKVKAAGGPGW